MLFLYIFSPESHQVRYIWHSLNTNLHPAIQQEPKHDVWRLWSTGTKKGIYLLFHKLTMVVADAFSHLKSVCQDHHFSTFESFDWCLLVVQWKPTIMWVSALLGLVPFQAHIDFSKLEEVKLIMKGFGVSCNLTLVFSWRCELGFRPKHNGRGKGW